MQTDVDRLNLLLDNGFRHPEDDPDLPYVPGSSRNLLHCTTYMVLGHLLALHVTPADVGDRTAVKHAADLMTGAYHPLAERSAEMDPLISTLMPVFDEIDEFRRSGSYGALNVTQASGGFRGVPPLLREFAEANSDNKKSE